MNPVLTTLIIYRYLHEVGDYAVSARVTDTALAACSDKVSLIYADLHNTAGCRFFELNRLPECRKEWEETMKVRRGLLPENSIGSKLILLASQKPCFWKS